MPSTYSPLLRVELMAVGEKNNTWGTVNNTNLGTLLEKSIAGSVTVDVTAGNVTLTALNGADDESRCAVILATGTPGVARNIVAPSGSKTYIVYNGANATVTFKGSATTGIALPVGQCAHLAWNGSDFVRASASLVSPVFTGTPTSTTASVDTNSAQVATTAFVVAQGYAKLTGTNATGTWPINVTGNALTATSAGSATSATLAANTTDVTSGTYTPSGIADYNCTGLSFAVCKYVRVKNMVHVCGSFNLTRTAAGTFMTIEFSVPISTPSSADGVVNVYGIYSLSDGSGTIGGLNGNNIAAVIGPGSTTTSIAYAFSCIYSV